MKRKDNQAIVSGYRFSSASVRIRNLPAAKNDARRLHAYFFCLLLLLVGHLWVPSAIAQTLSNGGLTISPALIDVTLTNPSEEKVLEFVLHNSSNKPLSMELYPIDFKQKDEHGGVSFLGQDSGGYSYSLASFLTFETLSLELAPGEKETVRVTAKNRGDLSPGGHYAAVVARLVQEEGQTSIAPAVSSLVLLRKSGGERYHLSLKEFNWPKSSVVFSYPSSLQLLFQNEGNVHLTPFGRIDITDMFGRRIYKGIINENSANILPESRRYISAYLKPETWSLPISINKMEIRGQDSLEKIQFVSTETFIFIHPTVPLVVIGIVIVLFVIMRTKYYKKHSNI